MIIVFFFSFFFPFKSNYRQNTFAFALMQNAIYKGTSDSRYQIKCCELKDTYCIVFGQRHLLNALNVNVNVKSTIFTSKMYKVSKYKKYVCK